MVRTFSKFKPFRQEQARSERTDRQWPAVRPTLAAPCQVKPEWQHGETTGHKLQQG